MRTFLFVLSSLLPIADAPISEPPSRRVVVRGVVEESAPVVQKGARNSAEIALKLTPLRNVFRACYERALNRNPSLVGRMSIEIELKEDGSVDEVAMAKDTLGDEATATCIRNRLKIVRFAPAAADSRFRFELTFTRRD